MPSHYTDTTSIQDGVDAVVMARGTGGVGEEIDKLDDRLYNQNTGAADIDATRMKAASAVVIASGVITVTQGVHTVTSESGTADELTTINITGSGARWFVLLKATSGHTITLKHATANIKLSTSADYILSGDKMLLFYHDGTTAVDLGQPGTGTTDEKAKVSSNDTTAGYLNGKLVAGSGIQLTENNDGGNETLTVTNTGAAGAALPVNAIPNSSFETWERGTSVAPDNWAVAGAGATIAREGTTFKHGTYSAKLTRSGADATLSANVLVEYGGLTYVRGEEYTFKAWVLATVASRARLYINDGIGSTFSSYHTGGSAWEELSVTRTLDGSATELTIGFQVATGDTAAYLDGCRLTEGASAPAYEPHVLPFNQFPRRAEFNPRAVIQTVGTVGITLNGTASQAGGLIAQQTTPANNDEFTFGVWLAAGTYTLSVLGVKNTVNGKLDWYVDNVSQFTGQDWYAASATYNTVLTGSVTVVGDGYHVIKAKVNGKHASSGNYYWQLTHIAFYQSAD